MKFTPSKYQQAIFDFIPNGQGNAIVNAVAGSGKSTTLIQAINKIPQDQSILFLAFNKSIVEELKIKTMMIENVEVKTLHSLGMRSITSILNNCKVDGGKYRNHLNKALDFGRYEPMQDLLPEEFAEYKSNIYKMVDLVRVNMCTDVDQFIDIARKHNLNIIDNELTIVAQAVRWGYRKTDTVDFTDMIYFPAMKKMNLPQYDWVFIDECQDLNAAQRALFLKCIKPGGRFIAVGDPKQAIYGFAGADAASFDKLKDLPNTKEFPLSVCYRCDADIINLAKKIVPQITAHKTEKGEVIFDDNLDSPQDGDMILCRLTAPLVNICMNHISSGVKAYIAGRDVGSNLVALLKKTNRSTVEDAMVVLNKKQDKLAIRLSKDHAVSIVEARELPAYKILEDQILAIDLLARELKFVSDAIDRIYGIFKDDGKQGICLSTIHKSKGLEADRVFIIDDYLIDDFYKRNLVAGMDWAAEQEKNLRYVAYTRAKHYLGFINY